MHAFARLVHALDAAPAERDQIAALQAYLAVAPAEDAAWAVHLLAGGRLRRRVPAAVLRQAARDAAGLPDWLFEASLRAAGELAETIACLLGGRGAGDDLPRLGLAAWIEQRLLPLHDLPADEQRHLLQAWWRGLDRPGCHLLVRLVGGGWRSGLDRQRLHRALAAHAGLATSLVAQRLQGELDADRAPDGARYLALIAPADAAGEPSRPRPFGAACAADTPTAATPTTTGPIDDWQLAWTFGGLRVQLVRRAGGAWIWSADEDALGARLPELLAGAADLPDGTVLDGELIVRATDAADLRPAGPAALAQRLQRRRVDAALRARLPVACVVHDLLEWQGRDLSDTPLAERRARLEALFADYRPAGWTLSPLHTPAGWREADALRIRGRDAGATGLWLRHRATLPGDGGRLWPVEPWTMRAVLLYAQAGEGPRAGLCSDCTLAVWNRAPRDAAEARAVAEAIARREAPRPDGLQLVTLARTADGLDEDAARRVDRVVRASTLERFGPVRSLHPGLVMELAFDGIAPSARHRCGLMLRGARLLRLREDLALHEAGHLPGLRALTGLPAA